MFLEVWLAFLEINGQRTSGFDRPNPLQFEQIIAWSVLRNEPLAQHEISILLEIDRVYLKEVSAKRERAQSGTKRRR